MRFLWLWVIVWMFVLEDRHMSMSITVTFPNTEPLYIALGRTLVLEAQFQLQPGENIILQTWERKNKNGEVQVAEGDRTNDNRVFVEKNGALLRINGVTDSDYGNYKVTVTDTNGQQTFAYRDVLKITNPPKAFLSMQCSILSEGAQWDRPVFSWQVDGVNVTSNQTGEISEDGSALLLENLGQNYTCITDSSQGKSKVDVHLKAPNQKPSPEQELSPNGCSCNSWMVFAVIELVLLLIIIILIGVYCYKKHRSTELTTI